MPGKLVGERLARVGHRIAAEHGLAGRHIDPVERKPGLGLAADDAEADVGVAGGSEHRPASRAAHSVGAVEVRPAAHDARNRVVGLLTPVRGVVGVGPVGTRHPLPDVPGQVERTGRRCPARVGARTRRPADPGGEDASGRVGRLVSPRPEPIVAAPRGSLPLRLGRKSRARPLAEGLRVVPRDVGDRSCRPPRPRRATRAATDGRWRRQTRGTGRFVTGIRLSWNAASETEWRGCSSGSGGYAPAGSLPIRNGPAGTRRHSIPARHAVAVRSDVACQFTVASSQSTGS